jgi:hypothetical protein
VLDFHRRIALARISSLNDEALQRASRTDARSFRAAADEERRRRPFDLCGPREGVSFVNARLSVMAVVIVAGSGRESQDEGGRDAGFLADHGLPSQVWPVGGSAKRNERSMLRSRARLAQLKRDGYSFDAEHRLVAPVATPHGPATRSMPSIG